MREGRREYREHREPREFREYSNRKRGCRFCGDKDLRIDYKDGKALRSYVSERGKIAPSRITSLCAYHQRELTKQLKRARILALIPYTAPRSHV